MQQVKQNYKQSRKLRASKKQSLTWLGRQEQKDDVERARPKGML